MREYSFRAKDKDTEEWVYGYYAKTVASIKITDCIIVADEYKLQRFEIDINTLGQYVGKTDEYGNKIYEGDVVYFTDCFESDVVAWNEDELRYYFKDSWEYVGEFKPSELRVIGNVHDGVNNYE